jgi:MFS family permease
MIPAILHADRRNRAKPVLLASVVLLLLAMAGFALLDAGLFTTAVLMLAFFIAFNVLEALLPSLVSRLAPAQGRGIAIGVYNTTQTLGVFFGGLVGGGVASYYGATGVFVVCTVLVVVWLVIAVGMRAPAAPVNEVPKSDVVEECVN